MLIDIKREELINILIYVCQPPAIEHDYLFSKDRIFKLSDQNNPGYTWKRSYLEHLSDNNLVELFKKYKK